MKLFERIGTAWAPTALALYLLVVALLPNALLCLTEGMSWQADVANVAVAAAVYFGAVSLSPRIGRTVLWFFPVLFFGAFEIVLLYLFGSSIIAVDMFLNLVTSNSTEMLELLGDMWPVVAMVFVVYLPLLVWGGVAVGKRYLTTLALRRRLRGLAIAAGGVGLVAMALAWFSGPASAIGGATRYNPFTQLFPLNAADNAVTAVERTVRSSRYHQTSSDWSPEIEALHTDTVPELMILVIGETSRAAQWQLGGYNRPTNPQLSSREGLVYFPYAMTESATTHKSVPMLLTSVNGDEFDTVYSRRGMIDAFSRAGYETWFISNQQRNGSLIDFLACEADTAIFVKDAAATNADSRFYDMDMLPAVSRKISGDFSRLLLVIHTYGSHFRYSDRYPESYRRFAPDGPLTTDSSCRDYLINAYDNTVVYTDAMLDSIISMAEQSGARTALLYVSDHGEDIFDDSRRRFLHASPVPTAWQLHVPMAVWLSAGYREAYPGAAQALTAASGRQVSTSRSVYPTMLSLAGIRSADADTCSAVTTAGYSDAVHLFVTDRNSAVSLDDAGFTASDREYMQRFGLK